MTYLALYFWPTKCTQQIWFKHLFIPLHYDICTPLIVPMESWGVVSIVYNELVLLFELKGMLVCASSMIVWRNTNLYFVSTWSPVFVLPSGLRNAAIWSAAWLYQVAGKLPPSPAFKALCARNSIISMSSSHLAFLCLVPVLLMLESSISAAVIAVAIVVWMILHQRQELDVEWWSIAGWSIGEGNMLIQSLLWLPSIPMPLQNILIISPAETPVSEQVLR